MPLQEQLTEDLKNAMRQGNETLRSVIRYLRSDIKYAEIAKGAPLDDTGVAEVISKQVKQHRESITEFKKGKREDLVAKEEAELAILLRYLPQQMDRSAIKEAAQKVIQEVGAKGPGDKGKVMGKLMPQLRGKAEGAEVSAVVNELLGIA